MHSVATSTEFGFGDDFPLKVQTSCIDTFQGMGLQHIFCNYFKYSHVTVFASDDTFGRMAAIKNSDDTYCHIVHLASIVVYKDVSDVDEIIAQAKYSGSNVFVFFMSETYTDVAVDIIAHGAKAGLFKEGTQIFGSEQMTNPALFTALEGYGVDVKAVMKGYMAMRKNANYHLLNSPAGLSFIARWRNQPATQWTTSSGTVECDQSRDGPDLHYVYRDGISMLGNHTCLGLDYSAFSADGSDLVDFLGNTYDATYALAYGMHTLIENNLKITGSSLHDAVIDNVDFIGASGHIDIFEGIVHRH